MASFVLVRASTSPSAPLARLTFGIGVRRPRRGKTHLLSCLCVYLVRGRWFRQGSGSFVVLFTERHGRGAQGQRERESCLDRSTRFFPSLPCPGRRRETGVARHVCMFLSCRVMSCLQLRNLFGVNNEGVAEGGFSLNSPIVLERIDRLSMWVSLAFDAARSAGLPFCLPFCGLLWLVFRWQPGGGCDGAVVGWRFFSLSPQGFRR